MFASLLISKGAAMTYLTSQLGHAESKHDPSMGRPPLS